MVCDRIGRIWATRQLCLFWIVGAAIFMGNNGSLGAVYAGRFIAGLGVGQTVVVAPIYLAEIVSSDGRSAHTRWVFDYIPIKRTRLTTSSLGPSSDPRSLHLRVHWFRLFG